MRTSFGAPAGAYDRANEAQFRSQVAQALERTPAAGSDLELGAGRIILRDSSGGRWALKISPAGVLSATAL